MNVLDNNNNQVNTNIANSGNTQESMSMAGMGRDVRILEMFRQARDRVWRTIAGAETPPVINETRVSPDIFRQNIEAEAEILMKQMYEEKKSNEENSTEENFDTVYSSEVVEMMRHLMNKQKERSKRQTNLCGIDYANIARNNPLMDNISKVVLKHIVAWDTVTSSRMDKQEVIKLYNTIDSEAAADNDVMGEFSRHLSKGAELYNNQQ